MVAVQYYRLWHSRNEKKIKESKILMIPSLSAWTKANLHYDSLQICIRWHRWLTHFGHTLANHQEKYAVRRMYEFFHNTRLCNLLRAHTTNWKVLAGDASSILPVEFGQVTLPLIKGKKKIVKMVVFAQIFVKP